MRTEDAIELLSEIGYDAVEIAVRDGWDADSAKMNKQRRNTLRKMIAASPLRLTSFMEHVYPTDQAKQEVALERLKRAADLANELAPDSPPLIQTVLGGGSFESSKERLVKNLSRWVAVADKTQTTIAIKPHRGGVVSRPSEAAWLIGELGNPSRLRIVYDYSHYSFRDMPMDETIQTALPFTAHVAVKDAVEEGGRVVFKLPGEAGTIDFAELIRQFHAGGYRGDINCEVSGMVSGKPGYDPATAARSCYRALSSAFRKSGVARKKKGVVAN